MHDNLVDLLLLTCVLCSAVQLKQNLCNVLSE